MAKAHQKKLVTNKVSKEEGSPRKGGWEVSARDASGSDATSGDVVCAVSQCDDEAELGQRRATGSTDASHCGRDAEFGGREAEFAGREAEFGGREAEFAGREAEFGGTEAESGQRRVIGATEAHQRGSKALPAQRRDIRVPESQQTEPGPSTEEEALEGQESAMNQLSTVYKSVAQKLTSCVAYWYSFCASIFIVNIIKVGYKLPFMTSPPKARFKNNASALKERSFVESEIENLISKGYVEVLESVPHVVNPLTVSTNDAGKKRLILDARHVNLHLFKFAVKYEGLEVVKDFLEPGGYMIKFDLESGYHHLKIFSEHQTYLGFAWEHEKYTAFYRYKVLPFGLSTACNVFTKFMKPLVKKWRSQGFKVVLYLDDGIVYHKSPIVLQLQGDQIRKDMELCGITLNMKKCIWQPVNRLAWLGIVIDLEKFYFSAPEAKVEKILAHVTKALNSPMTTARLVAQLIGQIIALKVALGPNAILFTRHMQIFVKNATSWDGICPKTEEVKKEMTYWKGFFESKLPIWPISESSFKHTLSLYTDASKTGYGGYIKEVIGSELQGVWTELESASSSTCRELAACLYVLKEYGEKLRDESIAWYTDNKNCVKILEFGSMIAELQNLALDVNLLCKFYEVKIKPFWIPREDNFYADDPSKSDSYAVKVNSGIFKFFDKKWGPYTSDWFGSVPLSLTEEFRLCSSQRLDEGVFCVDWSKHNNWLVPPPKYVGRVLHHLRRCGGSGTLVVPKWHSAPYWPLLHDENSFTACVRDYVQYSNPSNFFLPSSLNFTQKLKFDILVLKIKY